PPAALASAPPALTPLPPAPESPPAVVASAPPPLDPLDPLLPPPVVAAIVVTLSAGTSNEKVAALDGLAGAMAFQTEAAVDCSPLSIPAKAAPVRLTFSVRPSCALLIATRTNPPPCVSSRNALTRRRGSLLVAPTRFAPRRMKRA